MGHKKSVLNASNARFTRTGNNEVGSNIDAAPVAINT